MIHILFVVPYPQLEPVVQEVYRNHPMRDTIDIQFCAMTVDMVKNYQVEDMYDVIVGRNFTLTELKRQYPGRPVIGIPVAKYDVVRAVCEAKLRYRPEKIGIIGNFYSKEDDDYIGKIAGCQLEYYAAETREDLRDCVRQARREGCDCLLGGYSASLYLQKDPIHFVLIQASRETVGKVFDEAIHIAQGIQREQERAEMFRTIAQTVARGIIYVGKNRQVQLANKEAKKYFPNLKGDILSQAIPMMGGDLETCFATGAELLNRLIQIDSLAISANFLPVSVDKNMSGVVIDFENVSKIQQVETQIRQKMSEKGLTARYTFQDIIHESQIMDQVIENARRYAGVSSNVLIVGETGTGKELFAQSIHNQSSRKNSGFVAVNCAALPENLLESELFGYEEGAFTGSRKGGKMGLFELAHRGTLFLDEISEISMSLQSKLLRVLQEREVRRIGGDRVIAIDVRIIAATNKNLKELVREGKFRKDLLYRLDVLKIYVPPLRRRRQDIMILLHYYLEKCSQEFGCEVPVLTDEAKRAAESYEFDGNVRELRNVAERLCVIYPGMRLSARQMVDMFCTDDVDDNEWEKSGDPEEEQVIVQREEKERQYIGEILRKNGYSRNDTARELGIDRSTLWRKMKKYGL